jgi:AcrR family transcriptional regulator
MHVYNCLVAAALNKHQLKTGETRRKLFDAALRIFARDGFERSRLEDIAKEAGHTRGAFYSNFATKEDLFIALLEHQAAKRIAEISTTIESQSGPEGRRSAMRNFYINRARDRQWTMLTLEFKLYALRHGKRRAQLAAAHQRIRDSFHLELLNRIKPKSKMSSEDEKHAKILLEVIWGGLVLEHAYDPKRISAGEVTKLLGRMFDLVILETT